MERTYVNPSDGRPRTEPERETSCWLGSEWPRLDGDAAPADYLSEVTRPSRLRRSPEKWETPAPGAAIA